MKARQELLPAWWDVFMRHYNCAECPSVAEAYRSFACEYKFIGLVPSLVTVQRTLKLFVIVRERS